ncbi:hypothetical protein BC830DRAFT_1170690 [Chytriomyces sp. MP71]|nr:hypothetical protein BC830DRAFT_1170690 [Chytriomyces sp. MP71]
MTAPAHPANEARPSRYETQEEADKAFDKIEYLTINGRRLTVEWAQGDRKTRMVPAEMTVTEEEALRDTGLGMAGTTATATVTAQETAAIVTAADLDLALPLPAVAIALSLGTGIPDATETEDEQVLCSPAVEGGECVFKSGPCE